jgi:hypothetical protein
MPELCRKKPPAASGHITDLLFEPFPAILLPVRTLFLLLASVLWLPAQTPPPPPPVPAIATETFILGANTKNEAEIYLTHHLSSTGSYRFDGRQNAFVVTDDLSSLARIRTYFASRAQRGPQVRIEILYNENGSYRERSDGVNLSLNGNTLSGGIRPRHQAGSQARTVNQYLTVASGSTAFLDVSKQVPQPNLMLAYAPGTSHLMAGVQYVSAGTRMAVRPVVMENGDIEVEVIPEISMFSDSGPPQTVTCRTLSTRVIVKNGGTLPIGGFQGADDQFNRNFFNDRQRTQTSSAVGFVLRASIVGTNPGAEQDPETMKRRPLVK